MQKFEIFYFQINISGYTRLSKKLVRSFFIIDQLKNISEDTQGIPQSRNTALLRHQKKARLGTNKGKANAAHETTDT